MRWIFLVAWGARLLRREFPSGFSCLLFVVSLALTGFLLAFACTAFWGGR
jgi:hypothetical protein